MVNLRSCKWFKSSSSCFPPCSLLNLLNSIFPWCSDRIVGATPSNLTSVCPWQCFPIYFALEYFFWDISLLHSGSLRFVNASLHVTIGKRVSPCVFIGYGSYSDGITLACNAFFADLVNALFLNPKNITLSLDWGTP